MALASSLSVVGCSAGMLARADGIEKLTPDTANGKPLFTANCVRCHGTDATSGSARQNVPSIARSDLAKAADIVIDGDGDVPSFSSLTDQQIADILGYAASLP